MSGGPISGDPINQVRTAWNCFSADYLEGLNYSTESVHYGPFAPPESKLRLLGDVRGKRILELGCGGGHCAVALARQGAHVTAVDLSDAQIAYAHNLARLEKVGVTFMQGDMENLSLFPYDSWDIVISIYALNYLEQPLRCLKAAAKALRSGGALVLALEHPFHACFFDEEEGEFSNYPVRSYFERSQLVWRVGAPGAPLRTYHHTIAGWTDMLDQAGFELQRLLEPLPDPEVLYHLFPPDSARAPLSNIPPTIIFVATKRGRA